MRAVPISIAAVALCLAAGAASAQSRDRAFDEAVTCAASLQVLALAAPDWARDPAVAQATNLWLARVFALAPRAGADEARARDVVRQAMDAQVSAAASDPGGLSRRAAQCAANPPSGR
jgi:hypothetical protein